MNDEHRVSSWRQLLRESNRPDRRVIAAVTLALAVLGGLHALTTPLHRGPDETQHHDMVVEVFEEHRWPAPGERFIDLAIRRSRQVSLWELRSQRREAQEAVPRDDRPSWNDIEREVAGGDQQTGGRNPATQHPFLYYLVMAVPWAVLQSSWLGLDYDQAVVGLRLVNVLLVLVLPLLTYLTAMRLGATRRVAQVATVLMLAVPQLTHVSGLINNDNLVNPLGFMFLFSMAGVLRGRRDMGTAAAFGVIIGLGLLTKGFGLLWVPLAVAAYLWAARRRIRSAAGPLVMAVTTSFVIGGWWWLRNKLVYGVVQPQPILEGRDFPGPTSDLTVWWRGFGIRFVDGFWGRFGTLDAEFPRWSTVALWVALIVLVLVGFVVWSRERDASRAGVTDLVLLGGLSFGLGVLLLAASLELYLEVGHPAGMQGRYIFAGLSVVFLLAAVPLERWFGGRAVMVAAVSAATLQLAGLFVALQSWYGPRTGAWTPAEGLRAWAVWVAWSPGVVVVMLLAAVALVAGARVRGPLSRQQGGLVRAGDGATIGDGPEICDGGQ